MSDEKFQGDMPVTITVDIERFVQTRYFTNYNGDEEAEQTNPIVDAAVRELVKVLRKDLADQIASEAHRQIKEQVEQIVRETLDAEFTPMNEFGYASGKRTSLREQVGKAINDWAGTGRDAYGSRQTNLQKLVATEVDRQMQADMKAVRDENRQVIINAMKSAAATLLANEAVKR